MGNTFNATIAAATDWSSIEFIREHAVKDSGMFQLVGQNPDNTPAYTLDAGVDKFIREAMWFLLDRNPELLDNTKQSFSLSDGESTLALPLVRLARRVEIDGVELEQLGWDYFRDKGVLSATGAPGYWCYEPVQASTSPGLLIGPPPTEDITVDVWGRFYPEQLSDGMLLVDVHPHLLIDATVYKIQMSFGRPKEADTALKKIESKLRTLHIDQTKQMMELLEVDGVLTMEG